MSDNVKPTQEINTQQTEFNVPLARVLELLLDPEDIAEGDQWIFVDNSSLGLVVVRRRVTIIQFDENGDPIPVDPPPPPPDSEPEPEPEPEPPPEG